LSPLGEHDTVMLQPLCVMVHAVSWQVPESVQLPSTLAHAPVPPPLPLPELQASASADTNAIPTTHFPIRMPWA